ncbi:alternative oxidase-domain-containing protein [Hyaloraphidium curvatum]|nr:alternative oxidase-domain-containing protein [Hyaloraphidium curvatum]
MLNTLPLFCSPSLAPLGPLAALGRSGAPLATIALARQRLHAPATPHLPARSFSASAQASSSAPPADRAAEGHAPLPLDPDVLRNAPRRHVLTSLEIVHPKPMLKEYLRAQPVSGREIENWDVGIGLHRVPTTIGDRVAYGLVRFLRVLADSFFRDRYIARGVMLETVAAVPGQVAGSLRHLTSLRRMQRDGGWITHLLHEAENERMHLLTWMSLIQPAAWERLLVLFAQGAFWNAFFSLYLVAPRTAHRFVGYLEEEAVVSYTHMLRAIDEGKLKNVPAPDIAKEYWHLKEDATLRDVVLAVRADEANHRDVNHHLSDRLVAKTEDLRIPVKVELEARHEPGARADKEGMIPRIDLVPKA